MKHLLIISFFLFSGALAHAQTFLGLYEVGDQIPLMVLSSDPTSGVPVDPVGLNYEVISGTASISSGTMSKLQLGVFTAEVNSASHAPGNYDVLISGVVSGVTSHTFHRYTLIEDGKNVQSIGDEVSGLDGITPLDATSYTPFFDSIISKVGEPIASAPAMTVDEFNTFENFINDKITSVTREISITTREMSRSRLWYAQSTIDTPTRTVPADMPSHIEVQVTTVEDPGFTQPVSTFFHVYTYPNAVDATKASRVIRATQPPADGTFYLVPNIAWD